jgi:hypothetical protein
LAGAGVLTGAASWRGLRLADLPDVAEGAGLADEIAPDAAEPADDPERVDPADLTAPAEPLAAEPVTVLLADVLLADVPPLDALPVLACPGRACAKAVPRPSDAAAAPPVIHSDSLRILASLSSRRAAAR